MSRPAPILEAMQHAVCRPLLEADEELLAPSDWRFFDIFLGVGGVSAQGPAGGPVPLLPAADRPLIQVLAR